MHRRVRKMSDKRQWPRSECHFEVEWKFFFENSFRDKLDASVDGCINRLAFILYVKECVLVEMLNFKCMSCSSCDNAPNYERCDKKVWNGHKICVWDESEWVVLLYHQIWKIDTTKLNFRSFAVFFFNQIKQHAIVGLPRRKFFLRWN